MKNAKIVGAVIGSCISFLISGLCVGATYRNYEVNFIHFPQAKTNWCWAASAQSSGRHACSASTKTQAEIVMHTLGSLDNETATIFMTADAASYAANNTVTYRGLEQKIVTEHVVEQILRDHVPIVGYALPVEYFPGLYLYKGHMTTVTRFEAYTNVNQKNIYLYDPSRNEVKVYNFTDLYNGTNTYGTNSDGYVLGAYALY